ncbi:MAG TPA: hypothetical protein VNE21_04655 [Mycobacteriales bacterium]|nr:hypothetical protein [Mycobacteriales bacterium]
MLLLCYVDVAGVSHRLALRSAGGDPAHLGDEAGQLPVVGDPLRELLACRSVSASRASRRGAWRAGSPTPAARLRAVALVADRQRRPAEGRHLLRSEAPVAQPAVRKAQAC